jgi:hypothetical protein
MSGVHDLNYQLWLEKHISYLFCNMTDENRILVVALIRPLLKRRPKVVFLVQERVRGKCGHRALIRV